LNNGKPQKPGWDCIKQGKMKPKGRSWDWFLNSSEEILWIPLKCSFGVWLVTFQYLHMGITFGGLKDTIKAV